MKSITFEEALGVAFCQNITELSTEKFKKVPLKRGQILKSEDLDQIIQLDESALHYLQNSEEKVHEDETAIYIARRHLGKNGKFNDATEGRVDIIAKKSGLLKINLCLLEELNSIKHVSIATTKNLQEVQRGKIIAGARRLPFDLEEDLLAQINKKCENTEPLFSILPYKKYKLGIIKVGTSHFRTKKTSYVELLKNKFAKWNNEIVYTKKVSESKFELVQAIHEALYTGVDFLVVSSQKPFDQDENTSLAIQSVASEVISYAAPVFPGSNFLLAYKGAIPIIALSHSIIEQKTSVMDLVMPKIQAGIHLTKKDILSLAHGGLCDC